MEIDEYAMLGEEDIFVSEEFGELRFVPKGSNFFEDTCKHCVLYDRETLECTDINAKCRAWERNDGIGGYFVKQE